MKLLIILSLLFVSSLAFAKTAEESLIEKNCVSQIMFSVAVSNKKPALSPALDKSLTENFNQLKAVTAEFQTKKTPELSAKIDVILASSLELVKKNAAQTQETCQNFMKTVAASARKICKLKETDSVLDNKKCTEDAMKLPEVAKANKNWQDALAKISGPRKPRKS